VFSYDQSLKVFFKTNVHGIYISFFIRKRAKNEEEMRVECE